MATEPKFNHHRNPHQTASNGIHFFSVKVKVKIDPEVKVRSKSLRSWIELGGQVAYQAIRELSDSTNGVSRLYISQFDQKLLTKNVNGPKGSL